MTAKLDNYRTLCIMSQTANCRCLQGGLLASELAPVARVPAEFGVSNITPTSSYDSNEERQPSVTAEETKRMCLTHTMRVKWQLYT